MSDRRSDFINQGLYNFSMIRQEWRGGSNKKTYARRVVPTASADNIITCLDNNEAFEHPVPLRQLICTLDDMRELDGLYG